MADFIQKVVISPDSLKIMIDTGHIAKTILGALSITLPEADSGQATFVVAYDAVRGDNGMIIIQPDQKSKGRLDLPANTLKKLVQGNIWREEHFNGTPLNHIAKANNCSWTHVNNCIDLSFRF